MLVRKKYFQKCLFLSHVKKPFAPPACKWQWTGAVRGGLEKKLITFLLRGRMILCYHVNRFLTVSLLSEIFTPQNYNFPGENCSKNAIFGPNFPPDTQCRFFLKQNATVSSFIWSTNYTQSMREGFVWPFPILLNP